MLYRYSAVSQHLLSFSKAKSKPAWRTVLLYFLHLWLYCTGLSKHILWKSYPWYVMVQGNGSSSLQWTCVYCCKDIQSWEKNVRAGWEFKDEVTFQKKQNTVVTVWKESSLRLVLGIFLWWCLRPSLCEEVWRTIAVSLGWKCGLLREFCIRNFHCKSTNEGWGEEDLWVWWGVLFSFDPFKIVWADLFAWSNISVFYLSTEKVQLKLAEV